MPKNPRGESRQAFLQILADTVLDQVPDRITTLSQVSSPAARQAPRQFRAIRNDLHDENARFAVSPIQPGSRAIPNSRASSAGMVIWFLPETVVIMDKRLIKDARPCQGDEAIIAKCDLRNFATTSLAS